MTEKELTQEERAKNFETEYTELCRKHGFRHGYQPHWRYSQDGNDFRLVIKPVIVPIKPDE